MNRILVVFGTRPEAIKMAPLIKEIKKQKDMQCIVCSTGQHREMLDQVIELFHIKVDYELHVMKENQTLAYMTSTILNEMGEILEKEKPQIVLVHGDTTTTLAAALAAFYRKIPIGHVEAGLRTRDKYSPYPEEMNRQLVDCMTDLFFAPTQQSKENLLLEQKKEQFIFVTGNTAIDVLNTTIQKGYRHEQLDWVGQRKLILLTAHRRENVGEPMQQIFRAMERITKEFQDICVVYPIHLNPKVRALANEIFRNQEQIHLIEPLDVIAFHNFIDACYLVATDSGGIQEEASALGKPVLVLRDTSERMEGVNAGVLKLIGTKEEDIYKEIKKLLLDQKAYECMSHKKNPFGDGKASERIVSILREYFN